MTPNPTKIYHITHVDNLSGIIACGGLLCTTTKNLSGMQHTSIAHDSVQDHRARTLVPCAAGGCLHDYVPFYFAPRSPMLCSIHHGRVSGYDQGQEEVVHLVGCAQVIDGAATPFAFTDGHAIIEVTQFYEDLENLGAIDWTIMKATYWSDTQEDPD